MSFEIGGPPPPKPTDGQRLYVSLARGLAALTLSERMHLLGCFQRGDAFLTLPQRLRTMFELVAANVVTPPPPGAPW